MTPSALLPAVTALALLLTLGLSTTEAQTARTRQIVVEPAQASQATAANAPAADGSAADAAPQASSAPDTTALDVSSSAY